MDTPLPVSVVAMSSSTPQSILDDVADLQGRFVTLESKLIDVGVITQADEQSHLWGHRLKAAEERLMELAGTQEGVLLPMDAAWVLSCATLVFLMQLGFAQLEVTCNPRRACTSVPASPLTTLTVYNPRRAQSGMCRPKNVIATYMKNIIDFVLGTFCTLGIGYSIAYPQRPFIDNIEAWKFFFHLVFQATASTYAISATRTRGREKARAAYVSACVTCAPCTASSRVRWPSALAFWRT
jgi:hypothetical protein